MLKTVKVDITREIRQVSMKVWNGFAIVGFRLTDAEENHIVDLNWSGVGSWTSQDIPMGQEIVGLQCNTSKYPHAIPRIGLMLWRPRINKENEQFFRLGW